MLFHRILASAAACAAGVMALVSGAATPAYAQMPTPWQRGFQDAVTPVAERIHSFHDMLLVLISVITVFVLALLLYVMIRFNAKANPTPSRTTHNTMIEVLWTVVPVLILVAIAVPSFKLLYFADRHPNPDMTVKVLGYQWYWGYAYPDHGNLTFESRMVETADLKPGQVRLLSVDNPMVVPVDTNIRVLLTTDNVIHAWAVPSFGVKTDTTPGRINETWFRATKTGTYYGQCSELCGVNHGFMPVEVRVVSKAEFARWIASRKKAAGLIAPDAPVELAGRADAAARRN
jgi:cytochrome c oxidase subunit 2